MLGSQQQEQDWSPFIGPRPFRRDPEEQELFFGRNYESERIISLIYSHKLVLVYAQSGAGKTSLFNASIIPALEQKGLQVLPIVRVGIGSQIISTMPDQSNIPEGHSSLSEREINPYIFNVFQSLVPDVSGDELLKILTNDRRIDEKGGIMESSSTTRSLSGFLRDFFPHQIDQRGKNIPQVLIVDQLEELFNFYSDPDRWHEQQEDFFNQIANVLESDPLLRIVFVIREDYIAQIDPFAWLLPEKIKARFRLERLHKDAAYEAVKGPLEKSKAHGGEKLTRELFDRGVIDKLIDDLVRIRIETLDGRTQEVKGEFVEPIQLQVVCQRLWNKLKSGKIDEINQEYLGDIEKALEDFYVEAIREASEKTHTPEGIIRNWFDDKLITSSDTRGIVHRGVNSTGGIANNVVDILEKRYLIRKEERSGSRWYELTHDRLIIPIKKSNDSWNYEIALKKSRRFSKLKIILPVIGAAVVLTLFAFSLNPSYSPPCAVIDSQHIVPLGGDPGRIEVNTKTNMIYVARFLDDYVSVIDCNTNTITKNITVGTYPIGVAINPKTNMIYVANSESNTTSVIDGKTNTVIENIPVGENPQSVDVNPNTNMIYVANYWTNDTSVINGTTNTVVENIPVGVSPYDVAVNPNTNMIYVPNYYSNTTSVIDGATNTLIENITVGINPNGLDVNPNTNMIYVANYWTNDISVINGKTNTVIENITVGVSPYNVAVNPNTNMIYVANYGPDSISVINGTTNTAEITFEVGENPVDVAVNPNTNTIYIPTTPFDGGTVYVVNPLQKRDTTYIEVDDYPQGIDVNPYTNTVYVANLNSNTTSVINGTTNTVVENIPVGASPYDVAVNPNTNMIYVANYWTNDTSVINGTDNTVVKNIPVGESPQSVAVNPNTNMIYVANYWTNDTSVINGTDNTVVENIPVGENPQSVAVNPNTNMIYVANYGPDSISVINGTTNTVVENIPVGIGPYDVAVNPNTNMVYTSTYFDKLLSVINGTTNTPIQDLDVSEVNGCPTYIAIIIETQLLYLLGDCSNTITVINDIDGTLGTPAGIEYPLIGTNPYGIAYNAQSGEIYVSVPQSNTVYHTEVDSIRSQGQTYSGINT
jgi:YVTN family beta-propeller protein